MNLILVSRTEAKLTDLKKDLVESYGIDVEYISVDLTKPTEKSWQQMKAYVEKFDVGLIVNNAGLSYDHSEYFHLVD